MVGGDSWIKTNGAVPARDRPMVCEGKMDEAIRDQARRNGDS